MDVYVVCILKVPDSGPLDAVLSSVRRVGQPSRTEYGSNAQMRLILWGVALHPNGHSNFEHYTLRLSVSAHLERASRTSVRADRGERGDASDRTVLLP